MKKIFRALISVSDKAGVAEFAAGLAAQGVEILSTGGTAKLLREKSLKVRDVSEVTGFPEMLDGRVKTLHPKIHGGILAIRSNAEHRAQLEAQGIGCIDLVAVNLYPFEEMKNNQGSVSHQTRARLALKAFAATAAYDGAISTTLQMKSNGTLPANLHLNYRKFMDLRYGENPHQNAALYRGGSEVAGGLAWANQLQGKELSYNNLLDLESALRLVGEFSEPATAVIKHTNPCGAAIGKTLRESFDRAQKADPVSAFGSVIAFNRALDAATAEAVAGLFVEAVVAPGYQTQALEKLAGKKNLRLMELPPAGGADSGFELRNIGGGILVQTRDRLGAEPEKWKCVTERQPTDEEKRALVFAWRVAKHVKSNAIVYARDGVTVGVGAGQMSRVDSVKLGAAKARELGHSLAGTVVASDAFFPFSDGVEEAAKAGATAIVEPGGSVRDAEVIAAANKAGLAMLFTGVRHFRH